MTISAVGLIGILGVAVDLGRLYIAKNETQVYTDAAALAAATQLNGLSSGITAAASAAAASANSWNLNSANPTTATLEFGTSSVGPWSTNPSNPVGYSYVRASLPVQMPLMFLPMVVAKNQQQVASLSIASQKQITTFSVGVAPYTVVSTNTTGPTFGLTKGHSYSIQWPQFNGTRAGCEESNPGRCFNSPPCANDTDASRWAVASNWGSMTNGYWGFSANADIERSVLNGLQTQPVSVGQNLLPIMTNGNKAAQAIVLDQRANQDYDYASESPDDYQATTTHNGRRIILVPVVKPQSSTVTEILGFAAMLLYSDGSSGSNYYRGTTNGNDPFCARYVGTYVIGSRNGGAATDGSGAYRPRLSE